MLPPPQSFTSSAVWNGRHYHHFGIHIQTCALYGNKESEIVQLTLSIASNHVHPELNEKDLSPDYWGWFDFSQNRFTMIYPKFFLLNMCFPSGIQSSEDAGQGKAYRLTILET